MSHLIRKLVVALLLCACVCSGVWGATYQYATISKVPATELDWGTASNWETGTPYTAGIPSITNNNTYTITLNSDMKITGNFDIGSTSDNAITLTINLNGYNLSVSGTFNQNNKNPVNIKGPGTFSMNGYDLDGSYNHSLNLSNGAVVDIQNSMYTNGTPVTITDKDGTCTLYLPAGGQNTNYGAGQLTQSNITAIPSANTKNPVYTFAVASTQNPTGTTFDYTITVANTVAGNTSATSKYEVELLKNNPAHTITYTTSNGDYSVDKSDFSYTLDQSKLNSTTIRVYSSSSLEENEGVRITVKTPDGTMPLGVFEYIYKKWSWNGSVDTAWEKKENWTYNGILAADATGVPGVSDSVSIPSGCSHYPEIGASSSVKIQNVTIMPGANIKQTGGTFQVNHVTIDGSGVYSATGGTVQFVPYGGNAPAWKCDYPINSKLYNVEIPSGVIFQPSSDLYITGNLTANGTFDAATTGKTLFVVPDGTSSLKGSVSTIKLGKLDVSTTSSGKTFYLDGSLSTTDISVKGTLNALITVDGATGSYIQLATGKSGGEYIQFASASVPEIKGNTYTIASAIPYGGSVPNGWSYTAPATATWTGASDSDWSNSANWNPVQIPTGEIIIPKLSAGSNYPQLSVNVTQKAATITIEEGASLDLNGKKLEAFSLANHGTLNVGTGTLSVTDLTSEKTGTTDPSIGISTGTIQATSSITNKAVLSLSAGNWFSNALINDASGTMTLQTGTSLTLKDFINRGSLTFASEPTKMAVSGERQNAAGSLVVYTVANPTLSWGTEYENVEIAGSLTVGAGASWSITQAKEITFADAVINAGTIRLTADDIIFEKSVTNSSTGTMVTKGNLFLYSGIESGQGTLTHTGEIHFAGTAAQNVNISATSSIGDVVVKAGAKPTLIGNLTCAGLTIESTGSLDISNKVLTLSGDLTNSGTLTATSGTIAFTGASTVTGGGTFGTVTIAAGGSVTTDSSSYTFTENFTSTGAISSAAGGEMTFVKDFSNTGTIDLAGKTTFSGGSAQAITTGSTHQFADVTVSGAGGISLQNDCTFAKLTVTNGGVALNGYSLTVTGNWNHSGGDITASTSGKAVCNGTMTITASTEIAGNNTWNNLTCTTAGTTLTFAGGSTQKVTGVLTLTGTSASSVALESSDTSSNWILEMTSVDASHLKLSYVTVSHSKADPDISTIIDVAGTTVSEGTAETTTGWFKVITTYTWDNNSGDGSWTTAGNWLKGAGRAPSAPSTSNTELEIIIAADMTLAQNVTVQKFTVNQGKTVTLGTSIITATTVSVAGTLSTDGATTGQWPASTTWGASGTGTVEYTGTNAVSFTDDVTFQNLTCSTAKTFTITGGKTLTVNGVLILNGVTLTSSDSTNWNLAMGTAPDATNVQLANVTVSYSTASPAVSAVTDADGSTVSEGTYGTTTGWFGTSYTYTAGAWVRGSRTGVSAPPASDNSLTVVINDDYTLPGNVTYDTFTVNAAKKLTAGDYTVAATTSTINGTFITNGTTQNQLPAATTWGSGSIIIYTGTTATAQDYVTGADTIKVDKSSGTFTFGSGLSVAAGKSVTLANGAVSVSGDVSISVNGSLAVGASVPVTVTGNWTNNGTFNAGNNSTVTFAPSAADKTATITGDNTWQNLTCTTAGATLKFGAGTTQTVNGVFTVTGTTGSDITLDSTSTSPWVLKMSSVDAAHLQLSYVTVSHGTASPAIMSVIDVSGTTVSEGSSGTTTGWFYVVIPGTPFGVSYAFAVYGEKDLYVAFDEQIDPATLSAVPAALDLSSNAIRTGSSATMVQNTVSGTVVLLTLTDTVTVSHIQNGVLTATAGNGAVLSKDGSKHLDPTVSAYLTPLVVNLVSPLLATEDTDAGPHTIRLFDGSGTAANALSAGSDAVLQTKTAENVKYQLLITQNSGWQSQSGCENLASWLAIESQSLPAANTITATSTSGSNTVFDIPATLGLNKDKPVHFFFGLTDASGAPLKNGSDTQLMAICAPDGNPWQKMTLWSYSLSDVITQEGGVTIRNNVINSLTGEETVIQVELSSRGPLNVQILTLDGNVVKTLQKGTLAAGTHYFRWNGTNRNGAAVARGMYFVRISGKDIDQTRKVMVIRE